MGYPTGPLLPDLADRILHNLDFVDAAAPLWGAPDQNNPPFSDTQLLISLLGVLVFPHEKAPSALGRLMKGYKPLKQVLTVIHSRHPGDEIEITGADGEAIYIDPSQLKNLPGLLRNSIAHFNILPIGKEGRFAGVRVWNRAIDGQITFVADVNFDELRSMARHVLIALRHQREDLELRDPPDPMGEVRSQRDNPPGRVGKVPKIVGEIWDQFVKGHDGDHVASKISLDRWMKKEADRLRSVGTKRPEGRT